MGLAPGQELRERLFLKAGHQLPDFMKGGQLLPLIKRFGDPAFEIRVIEGNSKTGHDVEEIKVIDNHAITVFCAWPFEDFRLLPREVEEVDQIPTNTGANMKFPLPFADNTIETMLSC